MYTPVWWFMHAGLSPTFRNTNKSMVFFPPLLKKKIVISLCSTDCLTVNSLTACWRSEDKHELFMSVQNLASDEAFVSAQVLHRHGQNAVCWVLWSDDMCKMPHYLSTCRIPADFKKTESWQAKDKMPNTQRFQMHAFCSAVTCISVYFFDLGETNLSRQWSVLNNRPFERPALSTMLM